MIVAFRPSSRSSGEARWSLWMRYFSTAVPQREATPSAAASGTRRAEAHPGRDGFLTKSGAASPLGLITRTSDCPAIHLRISALDWRRGAAGNEALPQRTRLAARLRTADLWPGASVLSRGLRLLKASRPVSLAGDQPPAARSDTGRWL